MDELADWLACGVCGYFERKAKTGPTRILGSLVGFALLVVLGPFLFLLMLACLFIEVWTGSDK